MGKEAIAVHVRQFKIGGSSCRHAGTLTAWGGMAEGKNGKMQGTLSGKTLGLMWQL